MSSTNDSSIGAGSGEEPTQPRYETYEYFGPSGEGNWIGSIELAPGIHEWIFENVCEDHEEFIRKRRQVLIDTLVALQNQKVKTEEPVILIKRTEEYPGYTVDSAQALGQAPAGMPSVPQNF